jgi:hypothetical protein
MVNSGKLWLNMVNSGKLWLNMVNPNSETINPPSQSLKWNFEQGIRKPPRECFTAGQK